MLARLLPHLRNQWTGEPATIRGHPQPLPLRTREPQARQRPLAMASSTKETARVRRIALIALGALVMGSSLACQPANAAARCLTEREKP